MFLAQSHYTCNESFHLIAIVSYTLDFLFASCGISGSRNNKDNLWSSKYSSVDGGELCMRRNYVTT